MSLKPRLAFYIVMSLKPSLACNLAVRGSRDTSAFIRQIAKFTALVKHTHAKYGTSNPPAQRDCLQDASSFAGMATDEIEVKPSVGALVESFERKAAELESAIESLWVRRNQASEETGAIESRQLRTAFRNRHIVSVNSV